VDDNLGARTMHFSGFSQKALTFLKQLKKNNDKVWFDAHKKEFEQHLLQPLQALVSDLGASMLAIDPQLEVRPITNKTISRIYRDARFSKDKSPYKTTLWITFKRPGENWQDGPAYFFEIGIDLYRYGMGFYQASKNTMDKLREVIDTKPKAFQKAIAFYEGQKNFVVEGEQYKRVLDPGKPEALQVWYQRKSLYLVCTRKIDKALFGRKLLNDLKTGYALLAPLYHLFWEIALLAGKKELQRTQYFF
jgi:uncharacterized protein (TIGR02453 family)